MIELDIDHEKGDFHYDVKYKHDAGHGLTDKTIDYIAGVKGEARWITDFRQRALKIFQKKPMPTHWASEDLKAINFNDIRYYLSDGDAPKRSWEDVPQEMKETFERLGIPEQERKFLAGVEAQFDSEATYSNKFSALNSAVFSGGSFIYVPPGVKVKHPLQAYFRINSEQFGQFERTLIIVDEGAELTYMEGCTAPKFETTTLHSAVVELVAMKDAKIQYITVQNWSANVFNLVTKRGLAHENAEIRWIDCNIGSRLTMKYPGVIMKGRTSRTDTYPAITVRGNQHVTQHEASVSHVSEEQIFYLKQRGLSQAEAMSLSVNGFVNDLVSQFPMEYSVELHHLIALEMEGSVG